MQNAGPSYQGSATPGVNYTDHTYDSQGPHCQSSSYQPYMNATYHPLQSSRSHHYGNHQMHQMAPYGPVHHGGAYTPAQNQYRPSAQDLYRNHHPAYVGVNNNHSMPAKSAAWGENSTPNTDVLQSYNQMPPQPQMMNTPPQMPVSAMRSPPQGSSMNINATQSPVPQHYRQLQSPNDSPHSWSQVQAPSPGVLHSSRTTPSPISAHVRSPGISQPFSPPSVAHHSPASINVQQHTSSVVPENDQCSTLGSVSTCETASNPLHSLQKMVMLDQELKPNLIQVTCEVSESCDQSSSQSSAQNISAEQQIIAADSKDSSYPTYLTLGENCLEPQTDVTTSEVTPVSSVLSSSPILNCSLSDTVKAQDSSTAETDSSQTVSTANEECESTCTTSEQPSSCVNTCPPNSGSETVERLQDSPSEVSVSCVSNDECAVMNTLCKPSSPVSENQNLIVPDNSTEKLLKSSELSEEENQSTVPESQTSCKGPSIVKLSADVSSVETVSISDEIKNETEEKEVSCDVNTDCISAEASKKISRSPKRSLRRYNAGVNYEEAPSPEGISKSNTVPSVTEVKQEQKSPKKSKETDAVDQQSSKKIVNLDDSLKKEEPVNKAPVKVVIHRIRKSNTDDMWHVPNSSDCSVKKEGDQQNGVSCTEEKNDSPKNVGPQIIILSSAMSKKRFGIAGPGDSNSVITIDEGNTVIETVEKQTDSEPVNVPKKKLVQRSPRKTENSPRKKARSSGAKNKGRTSPTKKGKGKKVSKKRKKDMVEVEVIPKVRKTKVFSGPYVHITGSKESPLSITVVNVAPRGEEEKDQKNQKPKRDYTNATNSIQRKHRVGHSSTLSPSYDAFNRDKTWVCAFCLKGSHHQGLGDLYGPYYITDSKENKAITSEYNPSEKVSTSKTSSPSTPQASSRGMRSKRKRSDLVDDYIKSSVSRKRQNKKSGPNVVPATSSVESTPNVTTEVTVKSEPETPSTPETEKLKEVWAHEDCVVWCHGVSLMGQQLHGLEEAIRDALQNKCSSCKLAGATLGCRSKACTEQYHFGCAKEKGCEMDIEVFSLLCPKHLRKELGD